MEDYKKVEDVCKAIESLGLMKAIKRLFGAETKIRISFSGSACNTKIEELNLTVRSYNCLKREKINTVGEVIDAVQEDKLLNIRGLGKGSRAEIHVRVYEFGYYNLTERERKDFATTLLQLNQDKYKGIA